MALSAFRFRARLAAWAVATELVSSSLPTALPVATLNPISAIRSMGPRPDVRAACRPACAIDPGRDAMGRMGATA